MEELLAICDECEVSIPDGAPVCPVCSQPGSRALLTSMDTVHAASTPAEEPITGERMTAVAAYCTIFPAILILVVGPYRQRLWVRFHAVQSILSHLAWVLSSALVAIVVLNFIAGVGFLLAWSLFAYASVLLWCLLVLKAWREEVFLLPWLGTFALRLAQHGSRPMQGNPFRV